MARPVSSTNPFKVMEEEAYHAFLEWPVWLVLRDKELDAYLQNTTERSPADRGSTRDVHDTTQDPATT